MCLKVLNSNAKVLSRTSVFPVLEEELRSENFKTRKDAFEKELATNVGKRDPDADDGFEVESSYDKDSSNPQDCDYDTPHYDFYDPDGKMPEADDVDYDAFDNYIATNVTLPSEGIMKLGTVKRRKRDGDGNLIGHANANPSKSTAIYEVEFGDFKLCWNA